MGAELGTAGVVTAAASAFLSALTGTSTVASSDPDELAVPLELEEALLLVLFSVSTADWYCWLCESKIFTYRRR